MTDRLPIASHLLCAGCGEPFSPKWAKQTRFCSGVCKKRTLKKGENARRSQRREQRAQARRCVHGTSRWACHECLRAYYRGRYIPVRRQPMPCTFCGETFIPPKRQGRRRTCSEKCRKARLRLAREPHRLARRARERGARKVGLVTVELLRQRDGCACWICGEEMRFTGDRLHPRYRSIDHLVPLSLGGEHSLANTALACMECNRLRGDGRKSS